MKSTKQNLITPTYYNADVLKMRMLVSKEKKEIEIVDWLYRFTLDVNNIPQALIKSRITSISDFNFPKNINLFLN